MWYYKSSVGLMSIYIDSNGKYALKIDATVYGYYGSPVAATDDVYTHTTGCDEWDCLDGIVVDGPTDISEWYKN